MSTGLQQQFGKDGIVYPVSAISPARAAQLLPRFYELRSRMAGWTDSVQILKAHLVCTWVADLVRNDAVLDVIEELIGPNILCWTATFFAKEPLAPGYVGWHQDISYWGLDPAEKVVTAWLGLTDAGTDNGCMCFVPGTHAQEDREYLFHQESENMLLAAQEITLTSVEQDSVRAVKLAPGQFSVHHSRLIHGSYGNESSRPRIGLSINYMSTDVRQTVGNGEDRATLVRGVDAFGHFDLERRPVSDFDERSLEAYRESIVSPGGVGVTNEDVYDTRPDLARIA